MNVFPAQKYKKTLRAIAIALGAETQKTWKKWTMPATFFPKIQAKKLTPEPYSQATTLL